MSEPEDAHGGEPVARRPRRRWLRRAALTLLAFLLLTLAIHWTAGRRADKGLGAEIAAYRAAGEPATVDELNRWPALRSGEGENAVPLLRAAAAGMKPASPTWKAAMDALHPPPHTQDEVAALEALVKEGAESMAALDEAAARTRIDWDPKYTSPVMLTVGMPTDLSEQRGLAQLAHAAALAAHHRGDDAEALRRVGQMLFVGRALDHQPGLTYHFVALACDASAAKVLADLAPRLRVGAESGAVPPKRVRDLIDALLDERPLNEGQRRTWVGERVMQLDFPATVVRGAGAGTFLGMNLRIPGMGFVMRPWVTDNARVMARYTTAVKSRMEASADLPAFNAVMAADDPAPEVTQSPRRYSMAAVMLPSLDRAADSHYRALAHRRLAAVCLAARLHALDHGGALPEKLEDLVPKYLPSVPRDPLAAGSPPLRYVNERADAQSPRVYSVGADGKDDGGVEPPEDGKRPSRGAPSDEVRGLRRR